MYLLLDKKETQITISTSHDRHPSNIRWKEMNVTYIIEATGVFTNEADANVKS